MRTMSQLAQPFKPHRRQARRLDRGHVAAGAFDAQHLDRFTEKVVHHRLDGRIAATVQNEPRIAAEEPRRIDALAEIGADALLAIAIDSRLGVAIDPSALHCALFTAVSPIGVRLRSCWLL
jgi:hypothetical protein